MELEQVITDVAAALASIDRCGVAFKQFQLGVDPYGEPQLLAAVARHLNTVPPYEDSVRTKRTPDLLIPKRWALELKIARPFGDNGKEAETWSVNLLHPYEGNDSLLGDCVKLQRLGGVERKGVAVVGYGVQIGHRVQVTQPDLCHPVHQQFLVAAGEVLSPAVSE